MTHRPPGRPLTSASPPPGRSVHPPPPATTTGAVGLALAARALGTTGQLAPGPRPPAMAETLGAPGLLPTNQVRQECTGFERQREKPRPPPAPGRRSLHLSSAPASAIAPPPAPAPAPSPPPLRHGAPEAAWRRLARLAAGPGVLRGAAGARGRRGGRPLPQACRALPGGPRHRRGGGVGQPDKQLRDVLLRAQRRRTRGRLAACQVGLSFARFRGLPWGGRACVLRAEAGAGRERKGRVVGARSGRGTARSGAALRPGSGSPQSGFGSVIPNQVLKNYRRLAA